MSERYVGLMSGTSLDGIDAVLVDFSEPTLKLLGHDSVTLPSGLVQEFLSLNTTGPNELHRAALAANALVRLYAQLVNQLLAHTGTARSDVVAIGAHGQTVRHQPQLFDGTGYTIQLNNPALLAELTSIDVVADFRSRDVAAGGQGAPLVPAFHQAVFGELGTTLTALNIGGISNLTVMGPKPDDDVLGFDCGPGNALMDAWCQRHLHSPFDAGGAWAASGRVQTTLLDTLLDEPYFAQPAPKSTGRDLFSHAWLAHKLGPFPDLQPADVQATLTELTASACAKSVQRYGSTSSTLVVCGGGAYNTHLMTRLQALLPNLRVIASSERGIAPNQVEAAAFAWLARKTMRRETGNLEKATGARGARILGSIYPA